MGINVQDQEAEGVVVFWRNDTDTGKPVRVRIRPVPRHEERRIRAAVYGNLKARKAGDRTLVQAVERGEEVTARMAAYALVDTENFALRCETEDGAKAMSKLLGEPVQPKTDYVVDGRWTGELRDKVLDALPRFAKWICDKAEELAGQEAQEEDELGKI